MRKITAQLKINKFTKNKNDRHKSTTTTGLQAYEECGGFKQAGDR